MPLVLLTYYCALILVASIVGGMIPVWFQLTHRWMQFAVSFVAGVMLGVAVLHMLPHAIADAASAAALSAAAAPDPDAASASILTIALRDTMIALLAGMLAMFFIERFFSYHHHDVPTNDQDAGEGHEHHHEHDHVHASDSHDHAAHSHSHSHGHEHNLSWGGAAAGLMLHSILNGVALAAAVQHGNGGASWLAGFGTFLVIFLHKPFDAMTIGMLMAHGGWSIPWRQTVNALFSLAIPIGVLVFYFGLMSDSADASTSGRQWFIACALAFSAGTFLCISLSDLLPELQFHHHDRIKLSVALILGLALAQAAAMLESATGHSHPAPPNSAQPAN
jgi:zinc and cadmium transporter